MVLPQTSEGFYQYEKLEHREIRVAVLHPLGSNGEIRCDIKRISIDEDPDYEALSYTWGSTSDNIPVQVGSGTLWCTKSLVIALNALSPPSSHRTIWIDAICINQSDATERNHQVAFMKDIYVRASRVLIWLGPAENDSDGVMDYIGTVNSEPDLLEHKSWVYSEIWDWSTCRPWQSLPVAQESVNALLSRPWFSRIWIQQEAAVNRKTSVICGKKEARWDQLFNLAWSYQKPGQEGFAKDALSDDAAAAAILLMNIQSYTYEDIPSLLVDILRDCTHCGATDPRDRIYAVQSLARDPDLSTLILEPNYNENVSTVYSKMAERFLEIQGPFILSWAGRNNQRLSDLPSWVPDWTVKNVELPSILFKAAGNSQWDYRIRKENGLNILSTIGITLSSVSALTDLSAMPGYRGHLGKLEIFQQLRSHIKACITLIGDQRGGVLTNDDQEDLWRTLVTDSSRSWTRVSEDYGKGFANFTDWLTDHPDKTLPIIPEPYHEHLRTMNTRGIFIHRRFAIDSMGNLCIVPYSTMLGDPIVIIAGLALPLVVRPVENGKFEIIGECYVHGFMDGEAIRDSEQQYEKLHFC